MSGELKRVRRRTSKFRGEGEEGYGAFLRWKTFELAAFADPNAISHGRSDKGAEEEDCLFFFFSLLYFFSFFFTKQTCLFLMVLC